MKTWALLLGVLFLLVVSCGGPTASPSARKRSVYTERFFDSGAKVACPTGPGDAEAIQRMKRFLKSNYSIDVDLSPYFDPQDEVSYEPVEKPEMAVIEAYLEVAVRELQKHAPEFFEAAEIQSFAYVKEPVVEGYPVQGLASYEENMLLFSVNTESCATEDIADTLHHEMFHFFHGNPEPPLFKEADWRKLNAKDFEYDSSGDKDTEVNHPQPGFVSEYAMSHEDEDIAETFTAIMLGSTARLVRTWSQTDRALANKVAFIKKVMARTSHIYNESYWEKILKSK